MLELGIGRYEAALDAALEAQALWPLLSPEDAVEAAVRCGRPEVGQAAFDDFAPLAAAGGTPWGLGVMARCRALLARDDPRADNDYQQSIRYFQDTSVVLALARSRLVYGEWLRRQQRGRDARASSAPLSRASSEWAPAASSGEPPRSWPPPVSTSWNALDRQVRSSPRKKLRSPGWLPAEPPTGTSLLP